MKTTISGLLMCLLLVFCHLSAEDNVKAKPPDTSASQRAGLNPLDVLSELIEEQSTIINAIPDDTAQLSHEQEQAVRFFEKIRYQEAADKLAKIVLARRVKKPDPNDLKRELIHTLEDGVGEYPAAMALVAIGPASVDAIADIIKTQQPGTIGKRQLAIYGKIIKTILGQQKGLDYLKSQKQSTPKEWKPVWEEIESQPVFKDNRPKSGNEKKPS